MASVTLGQMPNTVRKFSEFDLSVKSWAGHVISLFVILSGWRTHRRRPLGCVSYIYMAGLGTKLLVWQQVNTKYLYYQMLW